GPSDPSVTSLYLSANAVLDAPDILVGTRDIPALPAGGLSTGSTPVTIPPGTASGTYFIVAKADGNGAIAETQENNNTKPSGVIRIGPDLAVSTVSATTIAGPGDTIMVSDTTVNQGGGDAGSSRTALYWSTNGAIPAGSQPLASHDVPALP